jgi:hypothetical protein
MKRRSTVQTLKSEIFKEQRLTIGVDPGDRWSPAADRPWCYLALDPHRRGFLMRIRRMYLDREHFTRVEELQQQWESAEGRGQLPQQLLPRLLQQLSDGRIAVTEYPRFADRAVARQERSEQVGQPPTAPKPILIDRFES